ncbi:MAG: DUF2889 domain-containing protein [Emcibacter sp.]|nr:DUF2889 domain-containing protein [Emcibacter sp.]
MPLSKPATRKQLHTRSIVCDGYERDDGLWDIEARMEDIKYYPFENDYRGKIEPGTSVHEMYIRLTLNDDLVVQDIEAQIDYYPFATCPHIADSYRKLIGVKMSTGFRRAVAERLGGKLGCTHLSEMLPVMATVAIQTIMPRLMRRKEEVEQNVQGKKKKILLPMINSCHSWASDGPNVKKFAPDQYTGGEED